MNNNTIIQPELVDSLLDDIGFKSTKVRKATKQHCLEFLNIGGEITWGDLNVMAVSFEEGYESALKRSLSGLLNEKRGQFLNWFFGKLRERCASPVAANLVSESEEVERIELMIQIDEIVEESGFGEEQES